MPLFRASAREESVAIRESLNKVLNEGEVVRNFILCRRSNWIISALLFIPLLFFILLVLLISLLGDSDDPWTLFIWPEWSDKCLVGVTNSGVLIARTWKLPKYGYRLGKRIRIPIADVEEVTFREGSGSGRLRLKTSKGRYRFKVKREFWITRSKQLCSIIGSMKYY